MYRKIGYEWYATHAISLIAALELPAELTSPWTVRMHVCMGVLYKVTCILLTPKFDSMGCFNFTCGPAQCPISGSMKRYLKN